MKKTMLFMAVALIVGAASAFSPKFNPTGFYNDGGVKSGPTDQNPCTTLLTQNCTVTDENGIAHSPVYDTQAHIGNPSFILKFRP
jgi:hypothetical protein